MNQENQDRWLSSASELSKRELEKEIAREFPDRQVQERTRYVSEVRLELKLGISEDLHELLKRVQDLVSSQTGRAVSPEETMRAALEFYVEKKDPMEKAKRAKVKGEKAKEEKTKHAETGSGTFGSIEIDQNTSMSVPGQVESSSGSRSLKNSSAQQNPRFIPAQIEHAVRLRDQGQCTYQSIHGVRCSERRWLDLHHVKSLSEGGATTLENLTLICRGHHQAIHHALNQLPMFEN